MVGFGQSSNQLLSEANGTRSNFQKPSELHKVNVLSYLGRVMEDVRKGYDGFREICTNIRQAPFTVPPGFCKDRLQIYRHPIARLSSS